MAAGSGAAGTIILCKASEIEEGSARGFAVVPGSRQTVIVLRKDGALYGWLDACPHYEGGTPMAWRSDSYLNGDRTHLACHSHGALFDIKTGACVLGPCLGQSLTPVGLQLTGNGDVAVNTPI